jgi:GGDEF domain-containing protein
VLAPFLLVAFCTTLLVENINTAKQRIRALSDRDELTAIYNMRAFTRLAEQEHEIASRTERPYSVLMVDIEHLKALNDTYGHEAGNRAVKLVAEALQRLTRSTDACRSLRRRRVHRVARERRQGGGRRSRAAGA